MYVALNLVYAWCLLPHIEQFRLACDDVPQMIRNSFEVSADGSFAWSADNPMYKMTVKQYRDEVRSAALAGSSSPIPLRSPGELLSPEFKARNLMWDMISMKYDSEQQLRARAGLELPRLKHMKGWNAYKKGQSVDARDMLGHHYRLIR